MPTEIKSKAGVKHLYEQCDAGVRKSFEHLPSLLDEYPMDVCLAYSFSRLELGQNMALYSGVVKIHKANAEVARNAVGTHHMTRDAFVTLYDAVFGFKLPQAAAQALKKAEDTRDQVMHGKTTSQADIRSGIARVLEYANAVNSQLDQRHNLKPFGDLRGFSGRARKLDKRTTRFMLKGMGFAIA